jgi:hypothetical protein
MFLGYIAWDIGKGSTKGNPTESAFFIFFYTCLKYYAPVNSIATLPLPPNFKSPAVCGRYLGEIIKVFSSFLHCSQVNVGYKNCWGYVQLTLWRILAGILPFHCLCYMGPSPGV